MVERISNNNQESLSWWRDPYDRWLAQLPEVEAFMINRSASGRENLSDEVLENIVRSWLGDSDLSNVDLLRDMFVAMAIAPEKKRVNAVRSLAAFGVLARGQRDLVGADLARSAAEQFTERFSGEFEVSRETQRSLDRIELAIENSRRWDWSLPERSDYFDDIVTSVLRQSANNNSRVETFVAAVLHPRFSTEDRSELLLSANRSWIWADQSWSKGATFRSSLPRIMPIFGLEEFQYSGWRQLLYLLKQRGLRGAWQLRTGEEVGEEDAEVLVITPGDVEGEEPSVLRIEYSDIPGLERHRAFGNRLQGLISGVLDSPDVGKRRGLNGLAEVEQDWGTFVYSPSVESFFEPGRKRNYIVGVQEIHDDFGVQEIVISFEVKRSKKGKGKGKREVILVFDEELDDEPREIKIPFKTDRHCRLIARSIDPVVKSMLLEHQVLERLGGLTLRIQMDRDNLQRSGNRVNVNSILEDLNNFGHSLDASVNS